MFPGSITQDQFLTSLRYLIVSAGAFATGRGWINDATLNALVAVATVLGPLAWGLYVNWQKSQQTKVVAAAGVQAGMNMTVSERAVDTNGQVIKVQMPNGVPPKPITVETATQIMKDFAPPPSTIAKT